MDLLGRRAPAPRAGDAATLADLRPGASALVQGFAPEQPPGMARRLRDLGFRPGADVLMLRRAPLGDPAVYRVTGSEICLRRADAVRVLLGPTAR